MREKELHNNTTPYLICLDHLVSNETYEVMKNQHLEMLVTSPIPPDHEKYYDSETYQSHNSSKKTVFNLIYNIIKKRSFNIKLRLFTKPFSNKTILDVGAGTGDFLNFCKRKGFRIYGVEPNSKAIKQAKTKGIKLEDNLDKYSRKKFDIITLWHVLEHVPSLYQYIESLKKMLAKQGQLFIAVPNHKSYDATYYKEYWAAYDVPRHLWHFSQKSIQALFNEVGMKVTKVHPLKYDAYYVSLLSEKYKTGKSNFMKAFLIGIISNIKARKTKEYSSLIFEIEHI